MSMTWVFAASGLDERNVENFMTWNRDVICHNNVHVICTFDGQMQYKNRYLSVCNYPYEEMFSIGRNINSLIRQLTTRDSHIVMKTDPDIEFSHEAINHIRHKVKPGQGLVSICANDTIEHSVPWSDMKKRRSGLGASFAMTKLDWFNLCGYDERIEGWGGDDDEMFKRASKNITMEVSEKHPIYHINHPCRQSGNFVKNSYTNMKYIRSCDWNDPNWGLK